MAKFRYYLGATLLFGALVAAYIAWQVGIADVLRLLELANKGHLAIYLLASLCIAVMLAAKWAIVLDAQGLKVPLHRLFTYRLVGYSVNYLTPTMHVGSEPVRAYLLKREGISFEKALGNVIIDKSVELMTNVLLFFLGALLILNSVAVSYRMKVAVLAVSFVLMLAMGAFIAGVLGEGSAFVKAFRFLRLDRIARLRNVERSLERIERQVEFFYRHRKRHFIALVAIMVLLWGLMYVEYRSILLFLGHEASLVQIFLILTGVGIAYAVPIPAAIGSLELGQLSAAKVLDLGSVTGVTLAFIIRARDLVWTVLGFAFLGLYQFDFAKLARKSGEIDKSFEEGAILPGGR